MSLAGKGVTVFFSNWLILPVQLLMSVILVRALGASGRGILVILGTLASTIAVLGQFGIPAASIYFLRQRRFSERTLLLNYSFVIVVVTAVCASLVLPNRGVLVNTLFHGASIPQSWIILALAGIPVSMASGFLSTVFLATGDTRRYAWLNAAPAVLALVGTLVLVVALRLGVAGALIASLVAQSVAVSLAVAKLLTRTRDQEWNFSASNLGEVLSFGIRYYNVTAGSQVFKRADNFILAYFLEPRFVGYYSVAISAYEAMLTIPRALSGLIAGESAADTVNAPGLVTRTARNLLWVMAIVGSGLAIITPIVVPLLYGSEFSRSIPPLLILLVASIFFGYTLGLNSYFLGVGRPGVSGVVSLLGGILNLGLSLALIPVFGLLGNALATMIGAGVGLALQVVWFTRLSRIQPKTLFVLTKLDIDDWVRRISSIRERLSGTR